MSIGMVAGAIVLLVALRREAGAGALAGLTLAGAAAAAGIAFAPANAGASAPPKPSITVQVRHRTLYINGGRGNDRITLRVPAPGQGALGIAALSPAQIGRIEHDFLEAVRIGAQRQANAHAFEFEQGP